MALKKILIVDDEVGFTKLVQLNLEKTGKYEVRIVNQGVFGLTAAKEFRPDLIFLDIIMPDMAGSDVALQLKEDEQTKDIPIVFLTAIVRDEELRSGGSIIGGHPFIAKPVSLHVLLDTIEKVLGK
ncbi:MAG: response regulator [Candidatus Omnitrophica bacterium]|nr:response regulator [Candidatus Omnitrophota bacterium]